MHSYSLIRGESDQEVQKALRYHSDDQLKDAGIESPRLVRAAEVQKAIAKKNIRKSPKREYLMVHESGCGCHRIFRKPRSVLETEP